MNPDCNRRFKFCRKFLRLVTPEWQVVGATAPQTPAVYLVQHRNFEGPVRAILWLDVPTYLWALSPFFNLRESTRRYQEITYRGKMGWPKPLAFLAAVPTAAVLKSLLTSARAIPVYRGSRQIVETFRLSQQRLQNEKNLLICPDRDYTNTQAENREYYDGFLKLEQGYFRATGKHLCFVPLLTDPKNRVIRRGDPIPFVGLQEFREEKQVVLSALMKSWEQLAVLSEKTVNL